MEKLFPLYPLSPLTNSKKLKRKNVICTQFLQCPYFTVKNKQTKILQELEENDYSIGCNMS
jgi:hypothetical protein